ncbi:MAG: ATP-dependent DNA helicase RecG [Chloracidobacterium sp.]|nr:ATP-dependent DNA helicase RecG [Chloracidobacterium sp.]
MTLSLDTFLQDLHEHGIAGLSKPMSKKLAAAVAGHAGKSDAALATVEDLLSYYPARWEDRSNFIQIDELHDGIEASVELFTRVSGGFRVGRNRSPRQPQLYIYEVSGSDRERVRKPVVVFWFLSGKTAPSAIRYYDSLFKRGTRFVAYGKWDWDGRRNTFALKVSKPEELEMLPPVDAEMLGLEEGKDAPESAHAADDVEGPIEDLGRPEFAMVHAGRTVPVYRKLGQFQTKRLREIMFSVLSSLDDRKVSEKLPAGIVKRNKLLPRSRAIREIHFPPEGVPVSEYEAFRSPAHRRLIFEEFFWLSLALQLRRGMRKKEAKGALIEINSTFGDRARSLLDFELTEAQNRVLRQILADMRSGEPMNRLLQGDVGSGKTIVAFVAMLAAMDNGYQAALMAPTEILAEQHARNAGVFFERAGYRSVLLTGSLKARAKRSVLADIESGEAAAVIGTHAIIQESVKFDRLGLAVIDEQHRFGVLQRSMLREMGYNPEILVMTATPIPRSLAMTVYGDLDVSVIDELPPGRTPIKTVVVGEDRRAGVYKGIERELAAGRQAYVVYPLIEESEKVDLKAATKMFVELRDRVFPKRSVGLIHGRLKADEKEKIMRRFVSGELDILVSTTVIEVGVDVPNATLMVIEHAELFGLSQLHQLRGRVGRGAEQSFCVLLTGDKKTAVAKERLGIMEETNDGFRIAEKDLEIRGPGEVLGTRQWGDYSFRIANIVRDVDILTEARKEAEVLLAEKRRTTETARLIEEVLADSRFQLSSVG